METIIYKNILSVEDYNLLRASVGWRVIPPGQARRGLENAAFLTAAYARERAVGMARLVYDGGYAALLVDVVVAPEFQGQGIGRGLLERVIAYLRGQAGEGPVSITLLAAAGKEPFYRKFGFQERPDGPFGAGMSLTVEPD